MAVFNRVLNILILILAIIALTFGYLLAKHRVQARERADKTAETLSQVAVTLDTNSGTKIKDTVNKDALSWKTYSTNPAKANDALKALAAQATTVQKQRDALGTAVANLNKTLGGAEVAAGDLQKTTGYDAKVTEIQKTAEAIGERDTAIATGLETMAAKIGADVKKGDLSSTSAETYAVPMKTIDAKVSKLYDNNGKMKSTLETVVKQVEKAAGGDLGFSPTDIESQPTDKVEKLNKGLDTMVQAVAENNGLHKELDAANAKNRELGDKVVGLSNDLDKARGTVKDLEDRVAKGTGPKVEAKPVDLGPKMFDTKIVRVNYDWNYVIIGLGAKDGLPPNVDMIVARDREYIATVHVETIYNDYAVANVLPRMKQGEIVDGDRVFYQVATNLPGADKGAAAPAALSLAPATKAPAAPADDKTDKAPEKRDLISIPMHK